MPEKKQRNNEFPFEKVASREEKISTGKFF